MHSSCKNCFHSLIPGKAYCSNCGQPANTGRLHISHMVHEFFHALFHADKGFFFLIKSLAVNPGNTALRYVQGERKRFFSPFNFLLIIGTIFLFFGQHFNNLDPLNNDPFASFLENYSNLILIVSLPLLAFITWIFFKNSEKNFSECLVLCCYLLGEMYLFYNLVTTPLILAFKSQYQIITIFHGVLWLVYFSWGAIVFFGNKALPNILRAAAVIIIFQFFTGLIAKGIFFLSSMGHSE